ncbi:MAG: hypothetical protein WC460_04265 [Patescibacteria group bacterium]
MAIDLKKLEKQKGKILAGLVAFQKGKTNPFFKNLSLSEKIEVYFLAEKKGFYEISKKLESFLHDYIFNNVFNFAALIIAMKKRRTRDWPWEILFIRACHLLESPQELVQLQKLSQKQGGYDRSSVTNELNSNFEKWLKKANTIKELIFLKKLVEACYKGRYSGYEYYDMIRQIDSCIFSLAKSNPKELLAIVNDDKYDLDNEKRQRAIKLLAA